MRTLPLWLLTSLVACDLVEGAAGDTAGSSTVTGTPPTTDWQPEQGTWSVSTHPCVGNRTDAMWWDDADTVWVGCGSTTVGYGLFRSTDGGQGWEEIAPAQLGAFRVSSLQRADDGLLYVAGIDTESKNRVMSLTGDGPADLVWEAGDQLWNSFHVGTFRRNPDGVAIAESLTGTGLVWRGADGDPFVDGSGWSTNGTSYQILDLAVHGAGFYGVGSTIATPPHVFLPHKLDPLQFTPVQLADWSGELWGVDVDNGGIVVGGVNQDDDIGMVFVSGADPEDADGWANLDVSTLLGGDPTWIRGVCRAGQLIAAVGEYTMRSDPILLVSADGGATWIDWAGSLPSGAGALHKCELWSGGRLAVTGQDGYIAVWNP